VISHIQPLQASSAIGRPLLAQLGPREFQQCPPSLKVRERNTHHRRIGSRDTARSTARLSDHPDGELRTALSVGRDLWSRLDVCRNRCTLVSDALDSHPTLHWRMIRLCTDRSPTKPCRKKTGIPKWWHILWHTFPEVACKPFNRLSRLLDSQS